MRHDRARTSVPRALLVLVLLAATPVVTGHTWLVGISASASDASAASTSGTVGSDSRAQIDRPRQPAPAESLTGLAGRSRPAPVASTEPDTVRRLDDPFRTPLLARVGELRVHQVAADPVSVGFHEAATSRALPMQPFGRLLANRNATRHRPAGDTQAGRVYAVMPSRGRGAHPTSAVDVALPAGEAVLAPVSGRVLSVRPFFLEGRYPDFRVEIQPDDAPELRVVVIHVDRVRVAPDDRVVAGRTPIADTARRFPFISQIDELTAPERIPHVHLEVQPEPPPAPVDASDGGTDPPPG